MSINITVYEVRDKSEKEKYWSIFAQHHYLSEKFNSNALTFIAYWNNILVGFNSYLLVPSGIIRDFYQSHRLVILPDYQGLGIGTKLNNVCGEILLSRGLKPYTKTAHYKLKDYFKKSDLYELVRTNAKGFNDFYSKFPNNLSEGEDPWTTKKPFQVFTGGITREWINRTTVSYIYRGKEWGKPHKRIIVNSNCNPLRVKSAILSVLDKNYYWDVLCDGPEAHGPITEICHELGLQSYALFGGRFSDTLIKNTLKEFSLMDLYLITNREDELSEKFKGCSLLGLLDI